jgi:hypothetical protein
MYLFIFHEISLRKLHFFAWKFRKILENNLELYSRIFTKFFKQIRVKRRHDWLRYSKNNVTYTVTVTVTVTITVNINGIGPSRSCHVFILFLLYFPENLSKIKFILLKHA